MALIRHPHGHYFRKEILGRRRGLPAYRCMPHPEPADIENRQGAPNNEHNVTRKTQPFKKRVLRVADEFQRTRIIIADAYGVIKL